VGLPFLAVQLIQMMREDKVEAAAIDAELDARDAARAQRAMASEAAASVSPAAAETAAADEPADTDRPWWETDSRFTERFKNA
jgi:hypothetical protein